MSRSIKIYRCVVCNKDVEQVSTALCRKLFEKNTKKILCLNCLSNELETEEEELLEKAREFREAGCILFQ